MKVVTSAAAARVLVVDNEENILSLLTTPLRFLEQPGEPSRYPTGRPLTTIADITSTRRALGPRLRQVVAAAAVAATASVATNALLALIGVTVFPVPADYQAFRPQAYAFRTVIGVIAAAFIWMIVARKPGNPAVLLRRLSVVVVGVSLRPDIAMLVTRDSVIGALTLMIMLVVVGVITHHALLRNARPTRPSSEPASPRPVQHLIGVVPCNRVHQPRSPRSRWPVPPPATILSCASW
ncbi:hypothetical protein [Lentzea flaviverrucosa]|uniref:hypothetical protein n=1 Tax=Lentzea flaviverrucosa TaxID=200379 RepID=UPI0011602E7A|nr:hypothetical protein [Lentzea flaviverrucosa]